MPPKLTVAPAVKLAPVIVTGVPPRGVPLEAVTDVTVGNVVTYLKPFFAVPNLAGVVPATFTAPAAPAGLNAVIVVALTTVKLVTAAPPNVTAVVPGKL